MRPIITLEEAAPCLGLPIDAPLPVTTPPSPAVAMGFLYDDDDDDVMIREEAAGIALITGRDGGGGADAG